MAKNHDALKLDRQLCFAVYAASHAFSAGYKPFLDPLGLTYPQYLVLLVLWEQDGLGVKQIGARLHLDSGTLTPLLKRLEASGLVKRTRDPEDERQVKVTLTQEGRALQDRVAQAREGLVCALGVSEPEIQALNRDVRAMVAQLREDQRSQTA